jgi:MFS family permease
VEKKGYKVKMKDGTQLGPLDDEMLRSWYEQGMITRESPILGPGVPRWTPLGKVVDLSDWTAPSTGRRGKGAEYDDEELDVAGPQRWRTRLAGVFVLAAAVGAAFWALLPARWIRDIHDVPWIPIAGGLFVAGLLLIPAWEPARKIVRLLALVAAILLFPIAGILIAEGVRGKGLLVLGAAWVLFSGLFALLAGGAIALGQLLLAILAVLAGAAGVGYFGFVPEDPRDRAIREWTSGEGRWADDNLGVTLNLPPGWRILRAGNPLLGAPAARVTLAHPLSSTVAWLRVDPAPRDVLAPDDQIDRVLQARRAARPSQRELGRSDVLVGGLAGRRADTASETAEGRFRDFTVVWKDGGTYFTLEASAPEAQAAIASREVEALLRGVSSSGKLAERLRAAVQAVAEELPHLTPRSAEILMVQGGGAAAEPAAVFRQSCEWIAKGRSSLPPGDAEEMATIAGMLKEALSPEDWVRLTAYVERVQAGQATSPEEDRLLSQIAKGAVLKLTETNRVRLQALCEKAVVAAARP